MHTFKLCAHDDVDEGDAWRSSKECLSSVQWMRRTRLLVHWVTRIDCRPTLLLFASPPSANTHPRSPCALHSLSLILFITFTANTKAHIGDVSPCFLDLKETLSWGQLSLAFCAKNVRAVSKCRRGKNCCDWFTHVRHFDSIDAFSLEFVSPFLRETPSSGSA